MEPIPPEVGMLKFCIRRVVTIMNKLTPSYYLYIEKRDGGSINLLFGKKVAFKKLSYYQIKLHEDGSKTNAADNLLGKLRATDKARAEFVLYDGGDSYTQPNCDYSNLRREYGAFTYKYEPCNIGNIRKMTVVFPPVMSVSQPKKDNDLFKFSDFRPTNASETLLFMHQHNVHPPNR